MARERFDLRRFELQKMVQSRLLAYAKNDKVGCHVITRGIRSSFFCWLLCNRLSPLGVFIVQWISKSSIYSEYSCFGRYASVLGNLLEGFSVQSRSIVVLRA